MLFQNIIKSFLTGTFIIFMSVPFCFAQDSESIPAEIRLNNLSLSACCRSTCCRKAGAPQRSNPDFKSTSSVSPPYRWKLSGGLFECSLDRPGWNRVEAADSLHPDSTLRKPIDKKFRMKKSPWTAVGLSALLPGAGQFYNKSYWKIPVVLGLVGYFAYEFYDNDKQYRDYRDRYSATQTPENPAGDENLKTLREFYFDQRNDFVWYFTIVYVINLIDAYIDSHLFDFDVREEKLTRFGITDKKYRLNVKVNF